MNTTVKLRTTLVISAISGILVISLLSLLIRYGNLELGIMLVGPIVYLVGIAITAVTTFIKIKDSIIGKLLYVLISLLMYMIIFYLLQIAAKPLGL